MFLKHCFMQEIDADIRLSLIVFKVNGALSRFYLLFNFDLVIMAFLNVLFMKGLLLYLIYFCFSGASFSRAELKVVLKHLRKSFGLEKISESPQKVITVIKEFFTFTVGKSRSGNIHYHFTVIRCSPLYSLRFHKKGSHICNYANNGIRVSTHVTS